MMTEEDEVLLQAYLDGQLPDADAERVRVRIGSQKEWARAEQWMRGMLGDVTRGFAAVESVGEIICLPEGGSVSTAWVPSRAGRTALYAAFAIAAALVGVIGATIMHETRNKRDVRVEVATRRPLILPPAFPPHPQGVRTGAGSADVPNTANVFAGEIGAPARLSASGATIEPRHQTPPHNRRTTATTVDGAHLLGV